MHRYTHMVVVREIPYLFHSSEIVLSEKINGASKAN
jgi:hypothetical protein